METEEEGDVSEEESLRWCGDPGMLGKVLLLLLDDSDEMAGEEKPDSFRRGAICITGIAGVIDGGLYLMVVVG